MVAVVAGNGLGLFNASNSILGSAGVLGSELLGQFGGRGYVNAVTGNLVLQNLDERLSGRGADLLHLRTYNSRGEIVNGEFTDGDGDGWRWDGERTVKFDAALDAVIRTDRDGSETRYTRSGSAYVSTDGNGAHDVITREGTQWVWTDGSSRLEERYSDSTSLTMVGRLQSQKDTSGNIVSFGYDGQGRLNTVMDNSQVNGEGAGSNQRLFLTYGVVPGTSLTRLLRVDTFVLGIPVSQVEYGYDTSGRLTSVTTDLTPTNTADNTTTPSTLYKTRYTYDGASSRIASIAQSDGTTAGFVYASFTYEQDPADNTRFRVRTVTDGNGTQTFTYGSNFTHIKISDDVAGNVNARTWTYTYDSSKQLIKVESPAPTAGAARLGTQFEYEASGNVAKVIDARGFEVTYRYDAQGNRTAERDAEGNTITRTYDGKNQLLTETRYEMPDPDAIGTGAAPADPLTTRFVYDAQSRLRFVITPEGRVSENRYGTGTNNFGLLTRSITYAASYFDVSALTSAQAPNESAMTAWLAQGATDKAKVQQTSYTYDQRGNLSRREDYATSDSVGAGVADAGMTVTDYVYSRHGELLQTIARRGANRDQPTILTSVAYDGMGRVIETISSSGKQTTVYDDVNRQIRVTAEATDPDLVTVSSYDIAGRLVSVNQSAGGVTRPATQYRYDAQGRLRMVQDPLGARRFSFYDETGRLSFQVDGVGAVTGYQYNASGQLTTQTRYNDLADTANWVNGSGVVTKTTLTIGAAGSDVEIDAARDRVSSYVYDNAGRLTTRTDAANVQAVSTYDGLSRLTQQRTGDRVTRYVYDGDGRLVGTVDPLGYLTENKFDAAGRLIETVRYGNRSPNMGDVSAPLWLSVSDQAVTIGRPFEYRLPAVDADGDAVTFSVVSKPSWMSLDAATGTLSGTPPAGFTTVTVTLQASDGRGGTPRTTDVTVRFTAVNTPPAWAHLSDATVSKNAIGFALVLPAAVDNESTAGQLVYSLVGGNAVLPPGLTFNAATRAIDGIPTTPGRYAITVRVTDGNGTGAVTERTFAITVTDNAAPSWPVPATPPATSKGAPLSYRVPPAVDAAGERLFYRAAFLPPGIEFDATTLTLRGFPQSVGQNHVLLVARDMHGAESVQSFAIEVPNRPPTWVALGSTSLHRGAAFSFTPPSATDPDGETLTYSIASSQVAGVSIDAATGRISGRVPNSRGTFTITLRATDSVGASVDRSYTIVSTNNPPVYLGGINDRGAIQVDTGSGTTVEDRTIRVGFEIASFSDPDGDVLTFSSNLGPLVSLTPGRLSASFLVGQFETGTHHVFVTFTASDGDHAVSRTIRVSYQAIRQDRPQPGDNDFAGLDVDAQALPEEQSNVIGDALAAWRPATTGDDLHSYVFYDGQGRSVGVVDERGFLSETTYDEQANTQQTTRYMGNVTVSASATLTSLRTLALQSNTEDPRTTTIEFDAFGRVGRSIGVDGTVTRNEYDSAGRLIRQVQADGTEEARGTRTRYNAFGEVTGVVGGEGDASITAEVTDAKIDQAIHDYGVRHEYDSQGRRVRTIDANPSTQAVNDNATRYFYDKEGRLTHTLNALGEVSETLYNAFGEAKTLRRYGTRLDVAGTLFKGLMDGSKSVADLATALASMPAGKNSEQIYEFDRRGLLTRSVDALGFETIRSYDDFGQLATQVRTILKAAAAEATTTTTRFDYDLSGRLLSTTADAGGLNLNMQMAYDAFGRVTRSVNGAGKVTHTDYQDNGRAIVVTDALNRTTRTEYDAFSRVLRQIDASGRATVYRYTENEDRVWTVTTPEGVEVITSRNRTGEIALVVDGRGNQTRYEYNKDGKLTKVIDALGNVVTDNFYDKKGLLTQTKDARGVITEFSYDALSRVLTRTVDPARENETHLNLQTRYEFDELGRQTLVTEAFGGADARVTRTIYDLAGQVRQVVIDPDTLNAAGQVIKTGLKLSTRFDYDGIGNTISVERGTVALPSQAVTLYVFDKLGRRVKEIAAPSSVFGADPTGRTRDLTTEYRYDLAGRVSRTINAGGQSTWFTYDAAGQLKYTINALGEVSERGYDANGRIVQARRYATRLSGATVAALGDIVTSLTPPAASSSDQRSFSVLDADGRERFTLQAVEGGATWTVAERLSDASGNVVETRRYDKFLADADVIAIATTGGAGVTIGEVNAKLTALYAGSPKPNPLDHASRTRFAYDANNRLRFTVDAEGSVSEQIYDAAGNFTQRINFAVRPVLVEDANQRLSLEAIDGAVDRANSGNQVTHMAYDNAGRLRFTVRVLNGGAQFVTETRYNALGQVVLTYGYAQAIAAPPDYLEATLADKVAINGALDRVAAQVYDQAGRLVYGLQSVRLDAQNGKLRHAVTRFTLDALGRAVQTTAYAGELLVNAYTQAALDTAVAAAAVANDPHNRSRVSVYDAAGRERFTIAADGGLTEMVFNALGQLTERRQFDLRVAVPAPTKDPAALPTEAALAAARGNRVVADTVTRGERYTYDAAGRRLTATDANEYTETYGYDALGNRTSLTDKNGKLWEFKFDLLGRQRDTIAPPVLVRVGLVTAERRALTRLTYDALGNVVQSEQGLKNDNDATVVDEARTTTFAFDRLGRQVMLTLPGYYNPNTGMVAKTATFAQSFQRTVATLYDALGNAVRSTTRVAHDSADNPFLHEYKVYDALGRQTADIDALGNVTTFAYGTAFNDRTAVTRHGVTLPATPGPANTIHWIAADVARLTNNDQQARTITMVYDQLGRKTRVTQPLPGNYYAGSTVATGNAASVPGTPPAQEPNLKYDFNVFGELIHEAVKIDAAGGGRWRDTWHYFDVMGRETRTVDAAGFHTQRTFDALGNLVDVIEYANPGVAGSAVPTAPATPAAHDNDRITHYVYDARNQQVAVERRNLRYTDSAFNDVFTGRNNGVTVSRTAYDGTGRQILRTNALGTTTLIDYNATGQVVRVMEAPRNVATALLPSFPATATTVVGFIDPFIAQKTVSVTTKYILNAFGEVVLEIRGPNLGLTLPDFDLDLDTTAVLSIARTYDHVGNVFSITDAVGVALLAPGGLDPSNEGHPDSHTQFYRYDYAGRLTGQKQTFTTVLDTPGGIWKSVTQTIERRFAYDAKGRQIAVLDVFTNASGSAEQSGVRKGYNVFGEIAEERKVFGAATTTLDSLSQRLVARYTYDKNGHVRTREAVDGITTFFYDLTGAATRQEQVARPNADGTPSSLPRRISEFGYDVLGRVVIQRAPAFSAVPVGGAAATITPLIEMTYDRWGNVTARTQGAYALGAGSSAVRTEQRVLQYTYNADNKVLSETRPTVTAYRDNGASYQATTVHELHYDLLGRSVREIERVLNDPATAANEAATLRDRKQKFDSADQLMETIDTLQATTSYVYDAFGNRVGTRDALGTVYVDTFDRNGNVLTHGVLRLRGSDGNPAHGAIYVSGVSQAVPDYFLVNRYRYDAANRRIGSAEVKHDVRDDVFWTLTHYDERSLLIASRLPADGFERVTYKYDAFGNRTDALDGNGNNTHWDYSTDLGDFSFGRLTAMSGGGRSTAYAYNGFGQVSSETFADTSISSSGANQRIYAYYENGLMKDVTEQTSRGFEGAQGGDDARQVTGTTHVDYTVNGELARKIITRFGRSEKMSGGSVVWDNGLLQSQRTDMSYDAQGRLIQATVTGDHIGDNLLNQLTYKYDELGNRRSIRADYTMDGAPGSSERWFSYDGEGRMTVVDGLLRDGTRTMDAETLFISYDALGRRRAVERKLPDLNSSPQGMQNGKALTLFWEEHHEQLFQYNDLGQVSEVSQRLHKRNIRIEDEDDHVVNTLPDENATTWMNAESRTYDPQGRLTKLIRYTTVFSNGRTIISPVLYNTTNFTYAPNGLLHLQTVLDANDHKRDTSVINTYDRAGNLDRYSFTKGHGTDDEYSDRFEYDYQFKAGKYLHTHIGVTSDRPERHGFGTTNTYDILGRLQSQGQANGGGDSEFRTFIYDTDGHIVAKADSRIGGQTLPRGDQRFFYIGDGEVAAIGSGLLAGARFDNGYVPFDAGHVSNAPGNYTVSPGDSLSSIALMAYGDAQLWYLIAEANNIGAGSNETLPFTEIGRTYRIPEVVGNFHNNADTFSPYDPARIIGSGTPGVYVAPPQNCDGVRMVVSQAIAIIVTQVVGKVLTPFVGPVVAGGIGGAAGNLAGQASAWGLGVRDDIDLGEVLNAGVAGALTAGFASGLSNAAGATNGVGGTLARAGIRATTGELVGQIKTGFSNLGSLQGLWNLGSGVSTSVLTAGADQSLSFLDSTNFKWSGAVTSFVGNAVGPSGWLFNDRSRDWVSIAAHAVSAVAPVAVDGVIDRAQRVEESAQVQSFQFIAAGWREEPNTGADPQGIFGRLRLDQRDLLGFSGGLNYHPDTLAEAIDGLVPEEEEYVVGENARYEHVAEAKYGDSRLGTAIALYNGRDPLDLPAGATLKIPPKEWFDTEAALRLNAKEWARQEKLFGEIADRPFKGLRSTLDGHFLNVFDREQAKEARAVADAYAVADLPPNPSGANRAVTTELNGTQPQVGFAGASLAAAGIGSGAFVVAFGRTTLKESMPSFLAVLTPDGGAAYHSAYAYVSNDYMNHAQVNTGRVALNIQDFYNPGSYFPHGKKAEQFFLKTETHPGLHPMFSGYMTQQALLGEVADMVHFDMRQIDLTPELGGGMPGFSSKDFHASSEARQGIAHLMSTGPGERKVTILIQHENGITAISPDSNVARGAPLPPHLAQRLPNITMPFESGSGGGAGPAAGVADTLEMEVSAIRAATRNEPGALRSGLGALAREIGQMSRIEKGLALLSVGLGIKGFYDGYKRNGFAGGMLNGAGSMVGITDYDLLLQNPQPLPDLGKVAGAGMSGSSIRNILMGNAFGARAQSGFGSAPGPGAFQRQ